MLGILRIKIKKNIPPYYYYSQTTNQMNMEVFFSQRNGFATKNQRSAWLKLEDKDREF